MRLTELQPVIVEYMPETLELGKLYISFEYWVSIHLCACGECNTKTVLPFRTKDENKDMGWLLAYENGQATFEPSIGCFQHPCKSHYYIRKNKIDWCD